MIGFDWNKNGKRDNFDRFMDMKVMSKVSEETEDNTNVQTISFSSKIKKEEKLKGISIGGKKLYDASKDSNGMVIFKCLFVTILCFGGIAIPVIAEMETLGTLLCIFGGLGLSILILKNV
ncbi:MAG: hypothetical protein IJE45_03010 [Bacilli bacterium]|nr:hypothetical protein [Bacilli bacterium]